MKTLRMTRSRVFRKDREGSDDGCVSGFERHSHTAAIRRQSRKRQGLGRPSGLFETKELGYAAEVWSLGSYWPHRGSMLRRQRPADMLGTQSCAGLRQSHHDMRYCGCPTPAYPTKVTYYMERRDPNFESKMRRTVLLVYQEVELQNREIRCRSGRPSGKVIDRFGRSKSRGCKAIARYRPEILAAGAGPTTIPSAQ